MRLNQTAVPQIEPITLAEAKLHLRVDGNDEDVLLAALITAARQRAENNIKRAFIYQTWELILDEAKAEIEIPLPPLHAVTGIKVIAEDGTETVVDDSTYIVDRGAGQPGRVRLKSGCSWPTHRNFASFIITFEAGYGDAAENVPGPIREAIKHLIAQAYENRGDTKAEEEMPAIAATLLWPYRIFRL
jgi:uncharacterized phiE125 gp8 family phage protein